MHENRLKYLFLYFFFLFSFFQATSFLIFTFASLQITYHSKRFCFLIFHFQVFGLLNQQSIFLGVVNQRHVHLNVLGRSARTTWTNKNVFDYLSFSNGILSKTTLTRTFAVAIKSLLSEIGITGP